MASQKRLTNGVRSPNHLAKERGGARYRIRPISPVGGGHQGGLLSPSGVGKANV